MARLDLRYYDIYHELDEYIIGKKIKVYEGTERGFKRCTEGHKFISL